MYFLLYHCVLEKLVGGLDADKVLGLHSITLMGLLYMEYSSSISFVWAWIIVAYVLRSVSRVWRWLDWIRWLDRSSTWTGGAFLLFRGMASFSSWSCMLTCGWCAFMTCRYIKPLEAVSILLISGMLSMMFSRRVYWSLRAESMNSV